MKIKRLHEESHHSFVEQMQFHVDVPGHRIKLSSLISPGHAERVTIKPWEHITHGAQWKNHVQDACIAIDEYDLEAKEHSLWFSSCCTLMVHGVDKELLEFQKN